MKSYSAYLAERPRVYASFIFIIWILLLVYGYQAFSGLLQDGGFTPPQSESSITDAYFKNRFVSPAEDINILVSHPTWTVDQPQFQAAYQQWKTNIQATLPVYAFLSWFDYPLTVKNLSLDRQRAKITARTLNNNIITLKQYKDTTIGNPLSFLFAGSSLASQAVNDALAVDIAGIEQGALPVLIVVLVLVFEGIVAMLYPLFLALWTIVCVLASLRAISLGFNVSNYTINATTIFGVGLAIDFSLFMHIRFKEEFKKNGGDVLLAVERTIATSGRAVLFSACTLTACLAGALQFHEYYLSTMALAVMLSAIYACIGALTFIPCMYLIIGRHTFSLNTDRFYGLILSGISIAYTKIHALFLPTRSTEPTSPQQLTLAETNQPLSAEEDDDEFMAKVKQGYWYRWVRLVMDHPIAFLIPLLGCLAGLMYVFIAKVRFGQGGTSLLPVDSEIRFAFDQFIKYIPSSNGAVLEVFMQTTAPLGTRDPAFLTALDAYTTEVLANVPHVTGLRNMVHYNSSVNLPTYISLYADPYVSSSYDFTKNLLSPFFITDFNQISRTSVFFDLDINDVEMLTAVHKLRAYTHSSPIASYLQANGVTGASAVNLDLQEDLQATIPYMIAVILCSMACLFTLLTGSLIIPIKAIVTAVLSIISSFAFLVLTFQDGPQNAQDLLKFIPNGVLDPSNLIFIFAVSFGLSLDYEIFMISRISELWERTHDHPFAVAAGIEQSARAITQAALLLCVVLGAFLASKVIILKEIGMGIGLTIILDATVIRCILVPAMMALFGEWTWWGPKPLQDFVKYAGLMERESEENPLPRLKKDGDFVRNESKSGEKSIDGIQEA